MISINRDYVLRNREVWDRAADEWIEGGERLWACDEPVWGIWGIPESELSLLPSSMRGMDAIELGCGTGYVSAWMARRGANPIGVDNSRRQLETALRLQQAHGISFPLIHGDAESVGLPDQCADFVISEYGAAIWADPYQWIPEAFRLLKRGGQLVFLGSSPWAMACIPPAGEETFTSERLQRDYFGMHRIEWDDPCEGVEFNLPISDWIRVFHQTGFEIVDYLEPRPPESGDSRAFFATRPWARRYPSEQVWKLRRP